MRRCLLLAFPCLFAACSSGQEDTARSGRDLLAEVDPFIGAGGLGFGVGSIPPGPAHPFGLARPGPDTSTLGGRAPSFSHCAGYWWEDDEIRAFSQIHLVGTGVPDYGALGLMPVGDLPDGPLTPGDWRARFDHARESAAPGHYAVQLLPSGIAVNIAATLHTALYELRYPEGTPRQLVVDLAHGLGTGRTLDGALEIDRDAGEVAGWLRHAGQMSERYGGFPLYFVLRIEGGLAAAEVMKSGRRMPGDAVIGPDAGAVLRFGTERDAVRLQVGLSFVDLDGARANLEAEDVGLDLGRARADAEAAWVDVLQRVQIEGGTADERRIFYTALFHAYGMPTVLSDVDGRYRAVDDAIRTADGWRYYSDFSLWDTFRTQHPLLTLLTPDIQADMNRSMWAMTEASGRVPKWPLGTGETDTMIAYHGESVLVDAALKGVTGFDVEAAYGTLRAAAMRPAGAADARARDCAEGYLGRGFCGVDEERGATSKTLEAAFSDFALAQFAQHLGHDADADVFEARAGSWRNLVDTEAGLLRGREASGAFPEDFREDRFSEDLVEGNARQWTVFVPHQVPEWGEALGGREAAVAWLDGFFTESAALEDTPLPDLYYWHGNEPDIHAPFLFAELDRPDLTRKWATWVMDTKYRAGPDGLDGNDDGGTLSAWYVFAALGLFPKVAEARYVLSVPRFTRAQVSLPGGELVIVREGDGSSVREIRFDGDRVDGPFIEHARLAAGGELVFVME